MLVFILLRPIYHDGDIWKYTGEMKEKHQTTFVFVSMKFLTQDIIKCYE